jgi:creatinine amidohydrolase
VILANLRWPEVEALDRETTVLIPTGSIEQHGPHLPLQTDTRIVSAVAEAVEKRTEVLLTPTLWLGCSAHHLGFAGSLTASFPGYQSALEGVIRSLVPHGFRRFYVLNGHGGNTSPNDVTLRGLKTEFPTLVLGGSGYYAFAVDAVRDAMTGPQKDLRHADEAEASLMLHLAPDLVKLEDAYDDGLYPDPPVRGLVEPFDAMTERGALGYPTYATAEKGRVIFEAAVEGVVKELEAFRTYVLRGKGPA